MLRYSNQTFFKSNSNFLKIKSKMFSSIQRKKWPSRGVTAGVTRRGGGWQPDFKSIGLEKMLEIRRNVIEIDGFQEFCESLSTSIAKARLGFTVWNEKTTPPGCFLCAAYGLRKSASGTSFIRRGLVAATYAAPRITEDRRQTSGFDISEQFVMSY